MKAQDSAALRFPLQLLTPSWPLLAPSLAEAQLFQLSCPLGCCEREDPFSSQSHHLSHTSQGLVTHLL